MPLYAFLWLHVYVQGGSKVVFSKNTCALLAIVSREQRDRGSSPKFSPRIWDVELVDDHATFGSPGTFNRGVVERNFFHVARSPTKTRLVRLYFTVASGSICSAFQSFVRFVADMWWNFLANSRLLDVVAKNRGRNLQREISVESRRRRSVLFCERYSWSILRSLKNSRICTSNEGCTCLTQ